MERSDEEELGVLAAAVLATALFAFRDRHRRCNDDVEDVHIETSGLAAAVENPSTETTFRCLGCGAVEIFPKKKGGA